MCVCGFEECSNIRWFLSNALALSASRAVERAREIFIVAVNRLSTDLVMVMVWGDQKVRCWWYLYSGLLIPCDPHLTGTTIIP